MIWESSYWKEGLLRHAGSIARRRTLKRWTDRSVAALEKDMMIGFYSIRKLIEAHKVSDEIRDRSISLQAYPSTGRPVTSMNWHKIDEKYNLNRSTRFQKPLSWICSQIVHSFVFMPCFDEGGRLDSVLFNSDRTRRQHLYSIGVDEVIALFEEIAANDPASIRGEFNERKGDYDFRVGPTLNPDEEKVSEP